jgi:hypothetical protein
MGVSTAARDGTVADTAQAPVRHVPQSSVRAGIALAVIVACQLIVVLDSTVVNIALTKIHSSLHFSTAAQRDRAIDQLQKHQGSRVGRRERYDHYLRTHRGGADHQRQIHDQAQRKRRNHT